MGVLNKETCAFGALPFKGTLKAFHLSDIIPNEESSNDSQIIIKMNLKKDRSEILPYLQPNKLGCHNTSAYKMNFKLKYI